MKKFLVVTFLIAATAIFLGIASVATAETPFSCDPGSGSLPSNDPIYPENQLILICNPANWNGDLIVYAHGYVPVQAPLSLPLDELTLPDGTFVPEVFLAQGFAFATSSYHKNGVATEQASSDLLDLISYFETLVEPGSLKRVFIIGASDGGLIAVQLIEQHPDRFDAGLALCAPVGGAPTQIKYAEDFRVVFDYFFPDVFPFGAFNVPPNAFSDWQTLYVPQIIAAMKNNPSATAQLFSVTRAAVDPKKPATFVETAIDILFYSIWGTPDLISTTGGIPYDNRITLYLGLTNNLALNRGVERVRGDRSAEQYAQEFYQTTGKLNRPLVTLHNTLDPIVTVEHELIYNALVALEHKKQFFTVLPVQRYGHCNFTTNEILSAFGGMLLQAGQQKPPVN
jgi:pimeloyl-ACP methyl ester carboxylesterase